MFLPRATHKHSPTMPVCNFMHIAQVRNPLLMRKFLQRVDGDDASTCRRVAITVRIMAQNAEFKS